MNTLFIQRIDEKLERRSEQRVTEVLNFVEFLESRERPALRNRPTWRKH